MILSIDSDAAYLVAPQARSRAGGLHYLGNKNGNLMNGSVAVIAKIIKNVAASAAEAEVGALLMSAQLAAPARAALEELGWPQPPAPAKAGSAAANGIANGAAKQQRSKATGMRLYWLKGRVEQGQFKIFWEPGGKNWAGYFTKHHPPSHHAKVRPAYLRESSSPSGLQGCIDLIKGHQPAGAKTGVQRQVQGLTPVAKEALSRFLGIQTAAQA